MSIMAYCRTADLIYTDSAARAPGSHLISIGSKVMTLKDWRFCSPDVSLKTHSRAQRVIDSLEQESYYIAGLNRGEHWELFLRAPDGHPFFAFQDEADDYAVIVPLRSIAHEVILGEGAEYCQAFLATGRTIGEAVTEAAILHPRCAIPIESF